MIKSIIQKIFKMLGYQVTRLNKYPDSDTMKPMPNFQENEFTIEKLLSRLSRLNIKIDNIIDVGASNGMWSRLCYDYFPKSKYFLVEANSIHKEDLDASSQKYGFNIILKALGEKVGKIYFDATDPFGGLAYEEKIHDEMIEVDVTNIDSIINEYSIGYNTFVKLDTHGIEKGIINGSIKSLDRIDVWLIEAYNFYLLRDTYTFWELIARMDELGYRPVDICDLMKREYDGAFWQMDILFIRKDHETFVNNSFRK